MHCDKCNVRVGGGAYACPLCQADLVGTEKTQRVFPKIELTVKPHRLLISLILLGTVVAAAVCIAINLSLPASGKWSLFVIAGIISLWLSFAVAIRKRINIPKNILWQMLLISFLALAWDLLTGFRGWSLDYVLPILITCALAALALVTRIMRLQIEDYMIYFIIDITLSIVSLIFLLCGIPNVLLPSAICVAASLVSLSALCIFEGRALLSELHRRTNL